MDANGKDQLGGQGAAGGKAAGGILAAAGAYSMWGLFPLYWHRLAAVEPLQILAHRIIWAMAFCVATLAVKGRLGELAAVFRDRRRFLPIALAGLVVTSNWGIYIWAINSGRVIESSLGYYINPILSVALGAIFFKEKIDRWTAVAVGIAVAGITAAAVLYGSIPVTSLLIAGTFAVYGALKKYARLDPLTGLAIETCVAMPLAAAWLAYRHATGNGSWMNAGFEATLLLTLAGVVTAIPLLLFGRAANSIPLQMMGFLQYISPTLQLLLGVVVFGERPNAALVTALVFVIVSAMVYAATRRDPAVRRKA